MQRLLTSIWIQCVKSFYLNPPYFSHRSKPIWDTLIKLYSLDGPSKLKIQSSSHPFLRLFTPSPPILLLLIRNYEIHQRYYFWHFHSLKPLMAKYISAWKISKIVNASTSSTMSKILIFSKHANTGNHFQYLHVIISNICMSFSVKVSDVLITSGIFAAVFTFSIIYLLLHSPLSSSSTR